jgi:hypothetical protein
MNLLILLIAVAAGAGNSKREGNELRCQLLLRVMEAVAQEKPSPLSGTCCEESRGQKLVMVSYLRRGFNKPIYQDSEVRYLPDNYVCSGRGFEVLRPEHDRMTDRPKMVVGVVLREKAHGMRYAVMIQGYPHGEDADLIGLCGRAAGFVRRGPDGNWSIEMEAPNKRIVELGEIVPSVRKRNQK